jgi:hypothetical protein
MVRGNPAVEGTYIGFVEDEDFDSMRKKLSELNKREVVQPHQAQKNRPRNTESRLRYKHLPFTVTEADTECPMLERVQNTRAAHW